MSTFNRSPNPTGGAAANRSSIAAARRRFLKLSLASCVGALGTEPWITALWRDRHLSAAAAELAQNTITVDLHCHANALAARDFPALDSALLANMKAGGVDVGLFAVRGDLGTVRSDAMGTRYEHRNPKPGELFKRAQEQLAPLVKATENGLLALAKSPDDIADAKKRAAPAALLAIEGCDPLEGDLSQAKFFYDAGVRVFQLMHYRINEIGDIQTAEPRHGGLTSFGQALVAELNRLGAVIDTAHASSETLDGVLAASRAPVIFSHTAPRVQRARSRRLADDDIKAIASRDGVVGIWPTLGSRDSFETFLRRLDYMKRLVGVAHFGIATDLFGLRGRTALPTHKEFALVAAGLLKRGYSESDTAKIVGGNFLRVFRAVAAQAS